MTTSTPNIFVIAPTSETLRRSFQLCVNCDSSLARLEIFETAVDVSSILELSCNWMLKDGRGFHICMRQVPFMPCVCRLLVLAEQEILSAIIRPISYEDIIAEKNDALANAYDNVEEVA